MDVRRERDGDQPGVREVHKRAFGDQGLRVAELTEALRALLDRYDGCSLVAEDAGRVVGHVMTTRHLLDAPSRLVDVQVLSPLGVLPEHQRRGVGAALVRAVLDHLAVGPAPLVFLEGDPRYYARFGFEPGGGLGFRRPSLRIPEAAFQVVRLPAYESWMTGTLVYAQVFWDLDLVGLRDPELASGPAGSDR